MQDLIEIDSVRDAIYTLAKKEENERAIEIMEVYDSYFDDDEEEEVTVVAVKKRGKKKKGEKIDDTESLEEKAFSGDKKAMEELKQRMQEEGAGKNSQQAGNADKKDAEFSHRIEEGQEQQQKEKVHLTPEAKETLREAILSAIRHPQGTVDPELLQRCIAEGLPEKAVLNAAVVARQRDAQNRSQRQREAEEANGYKPRLSVARQQANELNQSRLIKNDSTNAVGSIGIENLDSISVKKKVITEAQYTNLESIMTEFCKVPYMTELPLSFLDDLGRICRAIHLRRYKDTQAIQSDVHNSLSNCIGEEPGLNSITRHLQDFFNSLWQEYMIPSGTLPQTSPLHSAFQNRAVARINRFPQISSFVLSSQFILKAGKELVNLIKTGGKADKLDKDTILGDLDNPTEDIAIFIESIRALVHFMERTIAVEGDFTILKLHQDVMKCYSDVFQDDFSKKMKLKQRLDRILGKLFAPIYEVNCRGVNRSSIWGCCAAIIWAREGKEKPYWPAIVLGM